MSSPADVIKHQGSRHYSDGKWVSEPLEQTEANVLAAHPGVLTFVVDIRFPRCARFVLWASPAEISNDAFERECKKIRDETFSRLCEY
jgi:hypothetical protein